MTSSESGRTRAYDEDLRWKMIWQSEALSLSHRIIAKNLGVDKSTVSRTVSLFYATGGVTKKKYPGDRHFCILTTTAQMLILNLVVKRPGVSLRELQEELLIQLMVDMDLSTI